MLLDDNYRTFKAIENAIKSHRAISFEYDGLKRIVEPFTLGMLQSKQGQSPTLIGFQVAGFSNSASSPCWRRFSLAKIQDVSMLGASFKVREGFNPDDKAMVEVWAQFEGHVQI